MTDPNDPNDPTVDAAIGYADAVSELDQILEALEDPALDIDVLGDHVARAAELIAVCRARIESARLRVSEIVADLENAAEDAATET